ncbi:DUF535 family protein [Zemynaea arenosa]|uniref:DUF535 family protein n=1 Tax=Zemynaea arenosa TaxID=2561931 RepID=UPI001431B311|nr:DUF535 family protein [Massilia arenosa]
MILTSIANHVIARRKTYGVASWLLCIMRTARVLLYFREHQDLCRLPVYRNYVAQPGNDDLFHHLSHRHYLAKTFGTAERVRMVLTHYRYEDTSFDDIYKRHVYLKGGLRLWQQSVNGVDADIVLTMATRNNAEGDLTVSLRMDGHKLHRVSFSWVDGALAGHPGTIMPYISRNQGHGPEEEAAFARFNQAFPNNSPSYFCIAAMQGIAEGIGATHFVAVSNDAQVASRLDEGKQFANAYDGFWTILGGAPLPGGQAFAVPVPFYVKPLSGLASKHRKRAAMRREHWRDIGDTVSATIYSHRVFQQAAIARTPAATSAEEASSEA